MSTKKASKAGAKKAAGSPMAAATRDRLLAEQKAAKTGATKPRSAASTKKASPGSARKGTKRAGPSTFGPRIAPDLHERARQQSEKTGVSLSFVTRKALEFFVASDFFWLRTPQDFRELGRELAERAVQDVKKGKK